MDDPAELIKHGNGPVFNLIGRFQLGSATLPLNSLVFLDITSDSARKPGDFLGHRDLLNPADRPIPGRSKPFVTFYDSSIHLTDWLNLRAITCNNKKVTNYAKTRHCPRTLQVTLFA